MAFELLKPTNAQARYHGLRMSAEEYYQLEDDGNWYEVIDGVVFMSPSPTPSHQQIALHIAGQLGPYLEIHPVGRAYVEVDVHLGTGLNGGDLVYRPDLVFIRRERVPPGLMRISGAPDLIIEIISDSSRRFDQETKRFDYERFGVCEYWIVDPSNRKIAFCRLRNGRFVDVAPEGNRFHSEAVPGFVFDLARLQKAFDAI